MKVSAVLVLALVASAARQVESIVGGSVVTSNEFPSLLNEGTHSCGATLIHPKWALTAADCIPFYQVVAGDHVLGDVDSISVTVAVKRNVVHPDYSNTARYSNNIALLELAEPLTLTTGIIELAKIPAVGYVPSGEGIAVGWGKTSQPGDMSTEPKKVAIPVIPDGDITCETAHPEAVDSTMFCAGDLVTNADVCTGDGGGPLFCTDNNVQVQCGIISMPFSCGVIGTPGLYVNTADAKFRSWIESVIGEPLPLP